MSAGLPATGNGAGPTGGPAGGPSPAAGPTPAAGRGALAPYRVLDLTTERSWLTGRLLADLGATVTKIEPPGGDPGRRHGPHAADAPTPESSLTWWAYNRGKRSATVDLSTSDGRELFLRLVAGSHAVLESFRPGQLAEWGLGYAELAATNPWIVLTSVTPFGQTGPYAGFAASDLVLAAIGGPVWMAGDTDRPPVRTTVPQYFLHGAVEGAVHTLVALHGAGRSGRGQHVDVSTQLSTMRTLMNSLSFPHTDGTVMQRTTFGERTARSPFRSIYPCADGYVMAGVGFGPGLAGYLGWIRAEGGDVPEFLAELTAEELTTPALNERPPAFAQRVSDVLGDFFAPRTKHELTEQALPHRLMLVPINNVSDISRDVHLRHREYFSPVAHPDRAPVDYPTQWAHLSATPILETTRAPHVGEHNRAVWIGEAGLSTEDFTRLREAGTL